MYELNHLMNFGALFFYKPTMSHYIIVKTLHVHTTCNQLINSSSFIWSYNAIKHLDLLNFISQEKDET